MTPGKSPQPFLIPNRDSLGSGEKARIASEMRKNTDILAALARRSRKVWGKFRFENPGRRSQTRFARGYKYFTPDGVSKWPAAIAGYKFMDGQMST